MAIKLPNFLRRSHEEDEDEFNLKSKLDPERIDWVTIEEARELLDRQARHYLNMSGEEFARRYHAGEIEDYEDSNVIRVSYALSLAEGPEHGPTKHGR